MRHNYIEILRDYDKMVVKKNKYWLEIANEEYYNPTIMYLNKNEIEGFWVLFLYENIVTPNTKIENIVKKLVLKGAFKAVKIGLPYFDRLIVFTSCDKSEIYKTKKTILDNIKVKEKNMFWKAYFESEQAWEKNGYLDETDKLMCLYEKYLFRLNPNLIYKKQLVTFKCKMLQKVAEEILERRTQMIVKPVFGNIDYSIVPNSIFLIMPFGESWSNDTFDVIQDIAFTTKCELIRADNLFEPSVIIEDIWREINKAEIVIADITMHNANVFYEIGIAHTLGKRVILIRKEDGQEAPFDIKLWRYYDYSLSPIKVKEFKEQMIALINKMK